LLALIAFIFVIGVLIGAVSIGGIVIVPAIVQLTDFDIHTAIAAVVFSAIFSGIVGTIMYARKGLINWTIACWAGVGAIIGAYAGSLILPLLPGYFVEGIVSVLILFTGLHALLAKSSEADNPAISSNISYLAVGGVTGLGSAVSGAGGPLILVPLLLWLKFPILAAVALGQAIQIPVALSASVGFALNGLLDVKLGLLIAVCLMVGVVVGARISVALPANMVRRVVAIVLICMSIGIFVRMAVGQ